MTRILPLRIGFVYDMGFEIPVDTFVEEKIGLSRVCVELIECWELQAPFVQCKTEKT